MVLRLTYIWIFVDDIIKNHTKPVPAVLSRRQTFCLLLHRMTLEAALGGRDECEM